VKIYCLSGLGADQSVFDVLELNGDKIPIQWLDSWTKESMTSYAKRLCQQVDTSEPFILLGISLGGMLACEMNKFIHPVKTIIVSSVAMPSELPVWVKLFSKVKINRWVPTYFYASRPSLLIWYFGVQTDRGKRMIKRIAANADKQFTKLSLDKILRWRDGSIPNNLVRINGEKDYLLPAPKGVETILLKGAGHFAIYENSTEIAGHVNRIVKEYTFED
jgi:pimeloyl-ACP methyl ester carboxylesterase